MHRAILAVLLLASLPAAAFAGSPAPATASHAKGFQIATEDDAFVLRVRGFVQPRLEALVAEEPGGDGITALGFRIKRGRVSLEGAVFTRVRYHLQVDFVRATPLLDWDVGFDLAPGVALRVGQFKMPFSRQFLNSAAALELVDRAAAAKFFTVAGVVGPSGVTLVDRDIGATVAFGGKGPLTAVLGVFNGNGFDTKGNDDTDLAYVGRVAWEPLGPMGGKEGAYQLAEPRVGVGAAVIANPLPGAGVPLQAEVDATWRGGRAFVLGEAFYRHVPSPAPVDAYGFYLQGGWLLLPAPGLELAARYGQIDADAAAPGRVHEVAAGPNLYLHDHRVKVQANWVGTFREGADGTLGTAQAVLVQTTVSLD